MRLYLSSFRLGNQPETLVSLLGGRPRIAIVANADDYKDVPERAASVRREQEDLARLGFASAELDLREYFGCTASLTNRLASVDLLWVRGGNPFVLRRALRQSGADDLLVRMLDADALVYAGYSAGPAILAPTLRGLHLVDDPDVVPSGYAAPVIWDGLALLPYSILPHYRSPHPESPAITDSLWYMVEHRLPFIVLHDGEAIVRDDARQFLAGWADPL